MVSAKIFGLAGAAALLSTATLAADLPPPMPQPVYRAPVTCCDSGWYLRGDVGVGVQTFKSFDFHQTNVAPGVVWPATWEIDTRTSRIPSLSVSASATSGTTGCASTSPASTVPM